MRKESLILIILFVGWLITGAFICKKYICGASPEIVEKIIPAAPVNTPVTAAPVTKAEPYKLGAWNIADGRLYTERSPDHFRFRDSKVDYLAPTAGLNTSVNKTADYLKNNSNRSLDITGYYREPEKNNSIYPNLGLARAEKVKNMMLGLGVASNQISTTGIKLPDARWYKNNTMDKGIEFGFSELKKNDPRIAEIKNRLFGKPITLYFATNSDNINLNAQQRKDFADLNYYLGRVPSAKLEIGGHTDNIGDKSYNVNLSKERAEFAADYLTQRGGIAKNRMVSQGYGPDKPSGSNATADGRQKNRRVEVILK